MEDDGQLHASASLLHGKGPSLLTEKEDGWALEQLWSFGEQKNLLPMIGLEPQSVGIAACSSVTGPLRHLGFTVKKTVLYTVVFIICQWTRIL